MTVYYIPPYDGVSNVTAFTPVNPRSTVLPFIFSTNIAQGFRMLAGNAMVRNTTGESRGICHRCLNTNQSPFGGAPCVDPDNMDTSSFPNKICPGGIRTTVSFPTCWDGKNLDSPDHQSHVAYATVPFEPYMPPVATRPLKVGERGVCPETHPVTLPQLMYEVIFDTTPFNDPNIWPEDGSQPFVFAMGDA